MNRYSSNEKLVVAIKNIVSRTGATGDVQVLPRTCDRAFELNEYCRHGHSGCNYISVGDVNINLIYDGFLEAIIIDEDLLTLDSKTAKIIEKECTKKVEWLHKIREQQEKDYWESMGY